MIDIRNILKVLLKKLTLKLILLIYIKNIYKFLKKYKDVINEYINIENLIINEDKFKTDIELIFKRLLELVYDENDSFMDNLFKDNALQQKDSDNSKEEEPEEEDINSYYKEEEICKKLESIHLAIEPYKNQEKYDDFDEEKKAIS